MANPGKILDVRPRYVLPGGELEVLCEDFLPERGGAFSCRVDDKPCRITSSSSKRLVVIVPDEFSDHIVAEVQLSVGKGDEEAFSNAVELQIAGTLADEMHIVANPAVDPSDDAIIVTRSGSRGQRLENTIYRIETSGFLDELPDPVLNPTAGCTSLPPGCRAATRSTRSIATAFRLHSFAVWGARKASHSTLTEIFISRPVTAGDMELSRSHRMEPPQNSFSEVTISSASASHAMP